MIKLNYQPALIGMLLSLISVISVKAQIVAKPEVNRFTKVVLAQKLEEPIQFQILKDGRVLYAERKGRLKVYSPATGKLTVIAEIPVCCSIKTITYC